MVTENDNAVTLPPDEYLSQEEVMQLRAILQERANALLSNSQNTVTTLTDDRGMAPDALDLAASESSRDFSLRLAGRERQMLRKIRYCLQRMDEGEYGACESCGEPITYRRLIVRPVATLCIDCKTQAEQIERRSRVI